MFPRFFKLTMDGISLDRSEIMLYPALNKVLRRDRGSDGDPQGRLKLQAFKEFKYMYFICNPESTPNREGRTDKDKHLYAIEQCGLPKIWKPDIELTLAMKEYEAELTKSLSLKLVQNSRKAAASLDKTLNLLSEKLDNKIDALTNDSSNDDFKDIIANTNTLMELLQAIPNIINKLETAEVNLFQQMMSTEEKRGGGGIPATYEIEC